MFATLVLFTNGLFNPTPIKDFQTSVLMVNLDLGSSVSGVEIKVNIIHSYIGDLKITVSHLGKTAELVSQLGCGAPNMNVVFSDNATNGVRVVCDTNPGIGGKLKPEEALKIFDGLPLAGEWKLIVTDNVRGDEGLITDFQVLP